MGRLSGMEARGGEAEGSGKLDFPEHVLKRLRAAEARQRRETLARDLLALPVDVAAIWTGYCGCGCGAALDTESKWDAKRPPPLYPVIAHVLARGSKGEHTPENVSIWAWVCNRNAGHREAGEAASVKRFSVVKGRPKRGKIPSRGFPKTKRSLPSRPFSRKK